MHPVASVALGKMVIKHSAVQLATVVATQFVRVMNFVYKKIEEKK